jgi:hypothetical protein
MKRESRQRVIALAMVLALHLLAVGLLDLRRVATPPPPRWVTLKLIPLAPATSSKLDATPTSASAEARLHPRREAQPTRLLQAAPEPVSDAAPAPLEASLPTARATEPPLNGEPVTSSLLSSAATRRAIREAGRQPLLSERAASAADGDGHETRGARLARHMEKAGNGDCLKGEFTGAGAGLLSLPFFAFAEMSGKCSK